MASFLGFGQVNEHKENPGTSVLGGMCFGVLLFAGSLGLLGWNEKRAVYRARTIDKARDAYVDLDSCVPSEGNNDKLIVFTCGALPPTNYKVNDTDYADGVLTPAQLQSAPLTVGTSYPVLSWSRDAHGYAVLEQCTEEKDKDGKTTKSCTYTDREWVTTAPRYTQKTSPAAFPGYVKGASGDGGLLCVGDSKNDTSKPCNASSTDAWLMVPNTWGYKTVTEAGASQPVQLITSPAAPVYTTTGGEPTTSTVCSGYLQTVKQGTCASPKAATSDDMGDYRFSWTNRVRMPSDTVTYMAVQKLRDGQFVLEEWQNPDYSDCSYCTIGEFFNNNPMNGAEILDKLESENKVITWVLRFVGWILCWFAMQLCVAPVAMFPRMIPFVGDFIGGIVDKILCCVTCLFSTGISLLVMAIAWLAFRPMIGIPLLCACLLGCSGAVFLVVQMRKKRLAKKQHLLDDGANPNYGGGQPQQPPQGNWAPQQPPQTWPQQPPQGNWAPQQPPQNWSQQPPQQSATYC